MGPWRRRPLYVDSYTYTEYAVADSRQAVAGGLTSPHCENPTYYETYVASDLTVSF